MSAAAPSPPEESRALRVVVVVAVAIGVLAVAVQQAVQWWLAAVAIPALPAAALVAHRHRHGAPLWTKAVAGVLVPIALLQAMRSATAIATLDEARFTLSELFVVVQVAHALDLPRRRDLYVSLGSSLVLLAVAGSLSQDMRFGALLVVWTSAALAALVLAHRSSLGEATLDRAYDRGRPGQRGWAPMARQVAAGVGVAAAAGAAVLLVVPTSSGAGQLALPFRVGGGGGTAGGGLLRSPPSNGGGGGRADGSTYHGLATRMDLRVRGSLPDGLVMRVRSSARGMWRGAVFDAYDGVTWVGDEERGRDLGDGPVYRLFSPDAAGPRTTVTQTYYIDAELPTAIYGVGEPTVVYFPSGVSLDKFGLPRAEATLDDGLVFSVVSSYGSAPADQLRTAPRLPEPARMPPRLRRYLELPPVPDRVRALAFEVTAGLTNDYDRVKALEAYLRSTYRYRLDSPVPPDGQDAVDHFLFDAREGFCEQFAAAMTVMARTLGIAARVATGYVPGDYNAFTGFYSVHADDAHAWVEVLHPGFGWYAYDPTSSVPAPRQTLLDRVPLVRVARWTGRRLASLAPAVRLALVVLPLLAIGVAVRRWRGRRRPGAAPGPRAPSPVVARGPATAALARLDAALRARGSPRRPWETPGELLSRAAAAAAAGAVDRELFAAEPPDPATSAEAAAVIDRVVADLDAAPAGSGRLR